MTSIISVIVGFVLTGLIGNKLVQAWQARNWLLQQRFMGQEKEYVALKELADEIAVLLGARIYHMQRLAASLTSSSNEKLAARIADYEDILKRWNERLTSFYVRLPLLASSYLAPNLESSIQLTLVEIGANIEDQLRRRNAGDNADKKSVIKIQNRLNAIQGKAISFNKSMLRIVETRRTEIYYGRRIELNEWTLEQFSTWHLIKALFVRDINSYSIIRSSIDS